MLSPQRRLQSNLWPVRHIWPQRTTLNDAARRSRSDGPSLWALDRPRTGHRCWETYQVAVCVRLRHAPRGADPKPARRTVDELWMCTVRRCAPALSAVAVNLAGRRGSGVVGATNRQRRRRDDGAAYHDAAAPKTSLTDPSSYGGPPCRRLDVRGRLGEGPLLLRRCPTASATACQRRS